MQSRMAFSLVGENITRFILSLFLLILSGCDDSHVTTNNTFNRDTALNIIPITQVDGTSQTLTQLGLAFQFIAVDEIDGEFTDVSDKVTWHSFDPDVASIEKGQAIGLTPGISVIYAQAGERVSNLIELTVNNSPMKTLQINSNKADRPTGSLKNQLPNYAKQNLRAVASYADDTSFDVTQQVNWANQRHVTDKRSRVNNRNATITVSNGTAQMQSTGDATLQAIFLGQPSNPLPFTVSNAELTTLIISPLDSNIAKNSHQQFTAIANYSDNTSQDVTQHVIWNSNDVEVANIHLGDAEALSIGSAQITASLLNKTSDPATFTVIEAQLVDIQITPSEPTINLDSALFYKVKAIYEDGSTADISEQVLWESSQPDVTNVVAAYAKAYHVGQTQISASYQGLISNISTLTVIGRQLQSLQLTPAVINLAQGTQTQLNVVASYDDGVNVDITENVSVQTDNSAVVFINDGEVFGINIGQANLYAAFDGIRSNTATVNVIDSTIKALQVTPAVETVPINGTVDYAAQATFDNAKNGSEATISITQDVSHLVAWRSDEQHVALINQTAIGITEGHANIHAKLEAEAKIASLTVSNKTLLELQVTPAEQYLPEGLLSQYTAIATYSDLSNQDLTDLVNWSTSDRNIATLYSGEVEAVSPGEVTISATYRKVNSNKARLIVDNIQLMSINVTPAIEEMPVGTTVPYRALGLYSNDTNRDITDIASWKSTNTNIATVIQEEFVFLNAANASPQKQIRDTSFALVAGVTEGTTQISARLDGIESNIATLTINAADLERLQLTPANIEVAKGSEIEYKVMGYFGDGTSLDVTRLVQWKNSRATVATMLKGQAVAIGIGSTIFTATLGNEIGNKVTSNTATLTVKAKKITRIQVTPAEQTVALGVEQHYTAIATFSDGTVQDITEQVAWRSDNTDLATIVDGLVATQDIGEVKITANFATVTSNEATLSISNKTVTKLQLTPTHINFPLGTSKQLAVQATYTDNSTQDVTNNVIWALSNNHVAAIDPEQGTITATNAGTSNLVARWSRNNKVSNTAKITASIATLKSLHITPPEHEIIAGNTAQFDVLGIYSDNTSQSLTDVVDWNSADADIATILQGQVVGLTEGTASISASYQGLTANSVTASVTKNTLESITVTPNNVTMAEGTTQQFIAIGNYKSGDKIDISKDNSTSWRTSSPHLTIDENGLATAINQQNGITVFATKTNNNGVDWIQGSTTVDVSADAPKKLNINTFIPAHTGILTTGTRLKLRAMLTMNSGKQQDVSTLTNWHEDSDSTFITLDGDIITAEAPGTTQISAQYKTIKEEEKITISTIKSANHRCNIPEITVADHNGTSLTFSCPVTTDDYSTGHYLTALGFMSPAGMQMPLVNWQQANQYCTQKDGFRLPTREELYTLLNHVNNPDKKGWGLYLNYGWPMFLNYWSASKSDITNSHWTINMLTRYSWPAINDDSRAYSFSCVK